MKKVDAAALSAAFFTRKKMDLIKELDEVMREMIWLIRSQRPSANKTLFGKVYRAFQQAKGGKLTEKNKHSCDQYSVEKISEYQYRVYEHCQKHRSPDLLAKLDWSQRQVDFQFQGQNYADVLGLAASLVAPTIDCKVTIEDEAKLVAFQCAGFRITRLDHVIRFESLVYKKGKEPLMWLKGEVLKNLLPYSDYTIRVPLVGKVQIVEKKKVPDADETTPEQNAREKAKVQPAPQAMSPSARPIEQPMPPAPVDPRELPPMSPLPTQPQPFRPMPTPLPLGPSVPLVPEEGNQSPSSSPVPADTTPPAEMMQNAPPEMIEIK
ncbi:MAG: hypothetical protein JNL11_02650 [Bdellovibrionaceae bacterium]|nr:hypothetical protein [Pseudobdellovibrionaceae bacterium]